MKKTILITAILLGVLPIVNSQTPNIIYHYDTLSDETIVVTICPDGESCREFVLHPGLHSEINYFSDEHGQSNLESNQKDVFLANITSPTDIGGCIPLDNCFNNTSNKLYYYGGRNIIVVDANTNQKIKELTVSNAFDYSYRVGYWSPKPNLILYNAFNNHVYCATLDGKMVIIDCNTDEIVKEFYSTSHPIITQSLSISPNKQYLYLYTNSLRNSDLNKLIKIDCQTNLQVVTREFNESINYVLSDYDEDTIFLTTSASSNSIHAINPETLSTYTQFGHGSVGKIIVNTKANTLYTIAPSLGRIVVYTLPNLNEIHNFPIDCNSVDFASFNSINNLIYMSGYNLNAKSRGLMVINCTEGYQSFFLPDVLCHFYDFSRNELYYAKRNKIRCVDASTPGIELRQSENNGCESYKLTVGKESTLVSVNLNGGTTTIFNLSLDTITSVRLGANLEIGCINPINNKTYYLQTKSLNDESYVQIINTSSLETVSEIPIGNYLGTIKHNKHNNLIYILSSLDKRITILNGETDLIIDTLYFSEFIYDLYISKTTNKIYVTSKNRIYVINGINHQLINEISNLPDAFNMSFSENSRDGILYAASLNSANIAAISLSTNDLITNITTNRPVFDMCYAEWNNKTYVSCNDSVINNLFIIDSVNISSVGYYTPNPRYLAYNHLDKKIYCIFEKADINNKNSEYLAVIGDNYFKTIEFQKFNLGLVYNELNNKIYSYSFCSNNAFQNIISVDCSVDEICSIISLNQRQIYGYIMTGGNFSSLILDKISNKVFNGNTVWSNISVIQADHDILLLQNGWNWLSFPRMKRYGNDAYSSISVLEKINYFPLELTLYKKNGSSINYDGLDWSGSLTDVKSTEGYKLEFDVMDGPSPNIILQGARLHPDTVLTLLPSQENWIGYFIQEAQWPWDAFPSSLYDNQLTSITAQYWAMFKLDGQWYASSNVRPINYGDMVIVTINGNEPVSFAWNNPEEAAEAEAALETEYYSFNEQAEYLPIFIEKGAEDDYFEVAVLANGVVKGAAVVLETDTLVQVRAYLGDMPPGTPLEFETWSGTKSVRAGSGSYAVKNLTSGVYEHRPIYKGENAPFHVVSLKPMHETLIPPSVSDVSCAPNPFGDNTYFNFRLCEETCLQIRVTDLFGKTLAIPVNGNYTTGYYSIAWDGTDINGKNIGSGIYIFRLATSKGQEVSGKVVLIK